jgi:catechol 2,3-dioxygenase-like lactoylglutathione lyase family enzyme
MTIDETHFELRGVNHLALVCRDMTRTVEFYRNALGLRLTKTIELPAGMGQHFFFDIGGGDSLAFFWFPDAAEASPGVASPRELPGGDMLSGIGSMNHVALDIAPERVEEYRDRLTARGVRCSDIVNHDDSERGISSRNHEGVFLRSVYFFDPDGILLELAAWTRALGESDVRHEPTQSGSVTPAQV